MMAMISAPILKAYSLNKIVLKGTLFGLALVIAPVSASAASYAIQITAAHTFEPTMQHVKNGDTVTWVDHDQDSNSAHTVTPTDNPASFQGSGDITTAQPSFGPITISGSPRTIPYYCQYHGSPAGTGMAGKLIVDP
jgi:plastocyanin